MKIINKYDVTITSDTHGRCKRFYFLSNAIKYAFKHINENMFVYITVENKLWSFLSLKDENKINIIK
jgi:uncharacterized pyridoxamine 5'-phosphate oxidase family protein